MQWDVNTKGQTVSLDPSDLLAQLLGKVTSLTSKPDHESLVLATVQKLQSSEVLSSMNPEQLAAISFSLGYFYRIFLTNNEVETVYDRTPEGINPSFSDEPRSEDEGS